MKKIIILLVCLVIISSSSLFASPFHGGDGTSSNPYQIYNESELLVLINANNATTWSQHYILTNDITCSRSYTTTIGNSLIKFTGSFDGQGHRINNLTYNLPADDFIGLFGYIYYASISNLALLNVSIISNNYIGSLVAQSTSSTITNCMASGNVTGVNDIGGLISHSNRCIISKCRFSGIVNGLNGIGGLIAYMEYCSISNCSSSGNVSGANNIGGLISYINYLNSVINYCNSNSEIFSSVTGGSNETTGGLIGYISYFTTISNCYATGNITGTSTSSNAGSRIGGLIGWICRSANITNCFATGNITSNTSNSPSYNGGLVGFIEGSPTIINCYALGNVSSTSTSNTVENGGLIGYSNIGIINYCYSTGTVSATANNVYKGGFCGYNESSSSFTCCFWDIQTSGLNYGVNGVNISGVTGLTDLQMRDASNFPCFNKTTIWVFDGLNYPQLRVFFADKVPVLTEWSRYILIFSVLLVGCYFVYRKIYA